MDSRTFNIEMLPSLNNSHLPNKYYPPAPAPFSKFLKFIS